VLKFARSLKRFAIELTEELGFKVSRHMIRRFLKKLGYSWKRFRKSLKKKQNEEEYNAKFAELKQLVTLYKSNFIDLYFADESGFNMEGYVPYGWQPKGKYIEITPAKTKGIQIFGLMNLNNDLESYTIEGSMNSEIVIAFLDDFKSRIKQPTVIVLDNAPIHRSKKFEAKINEWKQEGLYIFFLPKYSPHLNPIEILWRMVKYHWLQYEYLESQEELEKELEKILCDFGTEFTIDFKEQRHSKKMSNIYKYLYINIRHFYFSLLFSINGELGTKKG
jgi:transposase